MYKSWGCRRVFFWPLGSSFPDEVIHSFDIDNSQRDIDLVFAGSKLGVTSVRYLGRLFGLYRRRRFMEAIERKVPTLKAYGAGWKDGSIPPESVPALYVRSLLGLNKHNSTGPINFRVFDLAAFGVMQICDNRKHLSQVYRLQEEVAGYETLEECLDLINVLFEPSRRSSPDRRRGSAALRSRLRRCPALGELRPQPQRLHGRSHDPILANCPMPRLA